MKEENDNLILYLHQDAPVLVKLFFDKNLKVINYVKPTYDNDKRMSYVMNPDGTKEYLKY